MSLVKSDKIKVKNYEKLTIFFLIFMTFQPLVEYYFREDNLIAIITFRIMFGVAIVFPLILLSLGVKPKLNVYSVFFLLVFVLNILTTIAYLLLDYTRNFSNIGIYFGMLTGFFLSLVNLKNIQRALNIIAVMGLILFPLIFVIFDFNIEVALRRGYTWTISFFLTGFYWAVIPLIILSIVYKKNWVVSFCYLLAAIFLNLIFIKRAIFIDSLLLLMIYTLVLMLSSKNILRNLLNLFVVATSLLLIFYFLLNNFYVELFDAVLLRFQQTSQDLSSFNRFIESVNYFKEASVIEVLQGKGFLGTHAGLGEIADALHVGWGNFILKGGVLLFIVVLIPYFKVPNMIMKYNKLPHRIQFSLLIIIVYGFRLFYVNLHSFLPEMVIFFYGLFNIMFYNKKNIEVNPETHF